MSKRMVTYKVSNDDKIASIAGYQVGSSDGDKSISRRMISYKVDDAGKITSIDGHELAGGGGGGDYEIKPLTVTANGVYDVAGEAYKPVRVNVPQTAASGTVKALLDATHSGYYLFHNYAGASVAELISSNDTANVRNMEGMFYNCNNLTTIPEFDTCKVTYMKDMFRNCYHLTTIPALDVSNVTNFGSIFYYCSKLASIGMHGFTRSISIDDTALAHDAIVAFLNQSGAAHDNSQKIWMGSAKLSLLSDEEKAIATNKGWTLA